MSATHYDLKIATGTHVYKAVPYDVLTNWLQQGRVIAADQVRPSGTEPWSTVAETKALAVFLPHAAAALPNDLADALQPVELGIAVRHHKVSDDDDVDMVPLIDISLVLLIFFMMTTTVAIGGANIQVPDTKYAMLMSGKEMLWVGIDLGLDQQAVYSFGEGERSADAGNDKLTLNEAVDRVRQKLKTRATQKPVVVRIAAHHRLPVETVQKLTARLSELKKEGLAEIKAEVTEKTP
jgi:biopolymer transport protein ExbD